MATVTLADMESKLLSIEEITQQLQKTEPLSTDLLDGTAKVQFNFDPDWAHGLDALAGTDTVSVGMRVAGQERQMSKEAVLQAAANFGLPAPYLRKLPARLATGLMNHHYSHMGDATFNMLSVGDTVSAFTRPTLHPFSNLQLLEKTVEGIQDMYGDSTPIFADYKFANTLQRTDVRLIIPARERIITNGGMTDVPDGYDDTWLAGLHLSNSLIGKTQTTVDAYMFRYWCTNGCTTPLDGAGVWSRRSNGQQDDIYEWAKKSVDEVLGGMEGMFDQIQALTQLNVTGNIVDVLAEIFKVYEVPVSQRDSIQKSLLGVNPLTMYSIMQAITAVANEPDMDDRRRDRLMRIGGALPTTTFDTLKAKVWREGHAADPDVRNPYEPLILVG